MRVELISRFAPFAFALHASVARGDGPDTTAAFAPQGAEGPAVTIAVQSGGDIGCPDVAELGLRLRLLRAGAWQEPGALIAIRYARDRGDFVASLAVVGPEPGVRTLRSSGATCEVLARNLTAALALVLDQPTPVAKEPAKPPSAPRPSVPPLAAQRPHLPVQDAPHSTPTTRGASAAGTSLHIVGGPALAFGLAEESMVAASLGMALRRDWLSVSLLGFVTEELTYAMDAADEAAGGVTVNVRYGGGQALGCGVLFAAETVEFSVCAFGAIAALRLEADGFYVNEAMGRPWYAVGGGTTIAAPLGASGGAALEALVFGPLQRERFTWNQTLLFEPPAAGVWLGVSGRVQIL